MGGQRDRETDRQEPVRRTSFSLLKFHRTAQSNWTGMVVGVYQDEKE